MTLMRGRLNVSKTTSSRNKVLLRFFKTLRSNHIPKIRIIAQEDLYQIGKQQVIATTYSFDYAEDKNLLLLDFGTAYLLSYEILKEQKSFKDFIVVTSPYNLDNQSTNEKEINRLKDALSECQSAREELNSDLRNAQNQIKDINKTVKEISDEFKRLQKKNKFLIAENKDLKKQHKYCLEKLSKCNAEKKELKTSLSDVNEKLKTVEAEYLSILKEKKALDKDLEDLKKENNKNLDELKDLKQTQEELQKEKNELNEKIKLLDTEKEKLLTSKKATEREFKILQTDFSQLEEDIAQKQELIKELEYEIENIDRGTQIDKRPMPVNKIYMDIISEIQKADVMNASNFKLSNMQIKLKTLINRDEEGMNLQLLDGEMMNELNGSAVSEVTFDIENTPRKAVEPDKLPDLKGYTETAVRRILNNLGLRLNTVYQYNPDFPSGESFKQAPKKNSKIQSNQLVTVIFSKDE